MNGDAKERCGCDRDHADEERDEVGGELKAPCRRVGAAAIELVEERPHLSCDRDDPADELRLGRKAELTRDDDRGEPLQRIQQSAGDAVPRREHFREIGSAELPRSGGP